MALPWLQRVELVLFAAAFLCGAVAAATLTRTQVRLRGRAGLGVQQACVGGWPRCLGARTFQSCFLPKLDKLPAQLYKLLRF